MAKASVTVYEIVNELGWVRSSLHSAKKYAGTKFEFVGVGWNIPKETRDYLESWGHQVKEYEDKGSFMENLYHGWNLGFKLAETDVVVPIAGDMMFHKNWLSNLLAYAAPYRIVNCLLIERGSMPSHHITKDFGIPPNMDEDSFHVFAKRISRPYVEIIPEKLTAKPFAVHKDTYLELGGEPSAIENGVTGDVAFIRKSIGKGIGMLRVNNSVVYHFQRASLTRFKG